MHPNCIKNVKRFQARYRLGPSVLDVGSWSDNPITGRHLWPKHDYTGADMQAGPNVDVVIPKGWFNLNRQFDVVTSLNTFEHCENPQELLNAIALHTKQNGFVFISVPWVFFYHKFPIDAWRISNDGLRILAASAGLNVVESYLSPFSIRDSLYALVKHQMRPIDAVLVAQKI